MSKKTVLKISLLSVLLLLLLLVAYLLLFYDFSHKRKDLITINNNDGARLIDSRNIKKDLIPIEENKVVEQKNNILDNSDISLMLKKKAGFFTERFGTYSNQSNFDNIKDLEIFMTNDMKEWAENFVELESNKEYSGHYNGVIVRSITSNVLSLDIDNGFAVVVVDAQKIESDTNGDKVPEMVKLRINFVDNNNDWLVNKADWQ